MAKMWSVEKEHIVDPRPSAQDFGFIEFVTDTLQTNFQNNFQNSGKTFSISMQFHYVKIVVNKTFTSTPDCLL